MDYIASQARKSLSHNPVYSSVPVTPLYPSSVVLSIVGVVQGNSLDVLCMMKHERKDLHRLNLYEKRTSDQDCRIFDDKVYSF